MAERQPRFVACDSDKTQKLAPGSSSFQCQTCFESFATSQGLRNHIGDFQLEIQKLSKKLDEARLHQSSLNDQHPIVTGYSEVAGDNDETSGAKSISFIKSDEDESVDDAGCRSGQGSPTTEAGAELLCPHAKCSSSFRNRRGLRQHFQLHCPCYESCVYCGETFQTVMPFLGHHCRCRNPQGAPAKEQYMQERCSQLRRYAAESLKMSKNTRPRKRTRKRALEVVDDGSVAQEHTRCSPLTSSSLSTQWQQFRNIPEGNDIALSTPTMTSGNMAASKALPLSDTYSAERLYQPGSYSNGSTVLGGDPSNLGLIMPSSQLQMVEGVEYDHIRGYDHCPLLPSEPIEVRYNLMSIPANSTWTEYTTEYLED